MYIDKLTQVMDAQAITASETVSACSVDLGDVTPKRRVGSGNRLSAVFTVTTAAAGDGSTLTDAFVFKLISSAAAALTSPTTILQRTIAAATLVAGYTFEIPLPFDAPTQRYLGTMVDLGGDDTISVDAWIGPADQVQTVFNAANVHYAKGYSV